MNSSEQKRLATAYAFDRMRSHPFIGGNERTGFVAAQLFLRLNGHRIQAPHAECVLTTLVLAAGDIDGAAFAARPRRHLRPLS